MVEAIETCCAIAVQFELEVTFLTSATLLLQYACMSETEKWRKDHLKAVSALKELLDTAEAKLNTPVQMSFLNLRSFLQDVEVGIDARFGAEEGAHILHLVLFRCLNLKCNQFQPDCK